jgi:hypothetical protein
MTSFDRLVPAAVVVMALLLAAPGADAKTVLDPGLWQDTETGTENGQPAKPEVTTDCMSAEDAADPAKSLSDLKGSAGQQCSKVDVRQSGNTFSIDMRCGDPKQFSMEMTATYTIHDRRRYSGRLKSTVVFGGQKTTSDKQIESKWIGACNK